MKVVYSGIHQALPPKIQAKLDAKFTKLAKMLDGRGEREARVIVTQERHLYKAEITLPFYDHKLVSAESDADLFVALSATLDKLEKQAVKQRAKWRERRHKEAPPMPEEAPAQAAAKKAERVPAKRVFKVNHRGQRKPITLDEAVLEMEKDRDYLVYRDAEREGLSVLVRRRDGHFDLIES